MASFGEIHLLAGSKNIGQIQVKDVYHPNAIFPRIVFLLGFTLVGQPQKNAMGEEITEAEFEIRDCPGELRFEENGRAVGALQWIGKRRYVRSYPYHTEDQVEFACDLDWARINAIEEHRNGGEARFWITLWPSLTDNRGSSVYCQARPIQTHVPRHKWNELLEGLTGLQRTLIEIATPALSSSEFGASLGHIKEAQEKINQGNFDEAVVGCRRAIETMLQALNLPIKAEDLKAELKKMTDDRRGSSYGTILSKLKDFGNATVHRDEAQSLYMRSEAQFVVATTAQFLSLLATLFRSRVQ